jgi:hypothetical protein
MTTVKNYMHMNDETIQSQKRKYSPGRSLAHPHAGAEGDAAAGLSGQGARQETARLSIA